MKEEEIFFSRGGIMIKLFSKFYNALGNTKGQKFWRLFLLLMLCAAVLISGFYFHSITISIGKIIGG
jgi:uncharacterized membrane protein YhaH (DUF805 family)